jgi:L-rhamnose mutarotase
MQLDRIVYVKTYAYTIELKNNVETINKYKEHHRGVWSEVLESGKKSGF